MINLIIIMASDDDHNWIMKDDDEWLENKWIFIDDW